MFRLFLSNLSRKRDCNCREGGLLVNARGCLPEIPRTVCHASFVVPHVVVFNIAKSRRSEFVRVSFPPIDRSLVVSFPPPRVRGRQGSRRHRRQAQPFPSRDPLLHSLVRVPCPPRLLAFDTCFCFDDAVFCVSIVNAKKLLCKPQPTKIQRVHRIKLQLWKFVGTYAFLCCSRWKRALVSVR